MAIPKLSKKKKKPNSFLTIFSSLAGGLRRKKQSGAKTISIIPIIVMSQGKPIAFAMAPPAEGPLRKQKLALSPNVLLPENVKISLFLQGFICPALR